jgi:N-acetylmuramoyl-L-alanine amidase
LIGSTRPGTEFLWCVWFFQFNQAILILPDTKEAMQSVERFAILHFYTLLCTINDRKDKTQYRNGEMMPKTSIILFLTAIVCSVCSFNTHPPQKAAIRTIIIDPGHGGFDPGTSGLFSKEKDVTLAISLKLGAAIQENFPDIKIVYTRTTDIMPGNATSIHEGLVYRANLANQSKGDLFLCIHANSDGHAAGRYEVKRVIGHKWVKKGTRKKKVPIYDSHWVKNTEVGTVTYIWKANWGEYKGSVINQKDLGEENMGDSTVSAFDLSSPEARMRAQLYEKKYFANSAYFATLVEDEFAKAGRHSVGPAQRDVGIWVLEATGMPSVLIETGFLTNEEEEIYLNSEDGQKEVVQNIIDALKRYKDSLEGTHSAPVSDSTSSGSATLVNP